MIIPNLMVTDLARSVAFYSEVLGMTLAMSVDAEQRFEMNALVAGAVFASLKWGEHELMLQSAESLGSELSVFAGVTQPSPAGTIYFRGMSPDQVMARASDAQIVKAPFLQWYGMRELYLRDPDGHILCVGEPSGNAPES